MNQHVVIIGAYSMNHCEFHITNTYNISMNCYALGRMSIKQIASSMLLQRQ
uniref:Uncharacterized protein n=1 Tax=Anguilla anguilla TaxID=7936 RepID=A0A0E9WQJ1_ANGAN